MELAPVKRSFAMRSLLVMGLMVLACCKVLRLPARRLPQPMRGIIENWTWGMFGVAIGSWLTRVCIDQPCRLKTPEPIDRNSRASGEFRLSTDELRFFYENGYLGPYPVLSDEQIETLSQSLLHRRSQPSWLYGFPTDRDLHFEDEEFLELLASPAILDRASQLLGPDLACWRSQVFLKGPGGAAIQWHQASTYMMEDYLEPVLQPINRHELFQITVWVALDDATLENGCLEVFPGTHRKVRSIRFGGAEGFYKVQFELMFDSNKRKPVALEVPKGHFILFSERVIHGSGPNRTDKRRMAVNFRLIPPSVRVYGEQKLHEAMHMGQRYPLDRWSLVLLRGEDRFGRNKTVQLHQSSSTKAT